MNLLYIFFILTTTFTIESSAWSAAESAKEVAKQNEANANKANFKYVSDEHGMIFFQEYDGAPLKIVDATCLDYLASNDEYIAFATKQKINHPNLYQENAHDSSDAADLTHEEHSKGEVSELFAEKSLLEKVKHKLSTLFKNPFGRKHTNGQ